MDINVAEALSIRDNFAKYKNVESILIKGVISKKPKYSIVIPTYKRVDTLKETLESALNQDFNEDYNIIVCDNNPERNDETEQYMSSLSDSRILYYKNEENIGMTGNWNRCFELCNGDYAVMIHDDDILFPHFLQISNSILTKLQDIDVLFPLKVKWHADKLEKKPQEVVLKKNKIRKITEYDLLSGNSYPPTGFIAKTNKILELGGFYEKAYPSSDYYFNVKAVKNIRVYELYQQLYIYRWAVNATLKLETLLGFLEKDIPLMNEIGRSCLILSMFREYMISNHCKGYIDKISSLYPEYNIKSLPYFKENTSSYDKTKSIIMSILWKIVYIIKKKRTSVSIK